MAEAPPPGFIPMRQQIDVPRLARYLEEIELDGFYNEDLHVFQANNGMSNPTYLLYSGRAPGNKFVVRKKPPGDGLKGAHQVDREYRIMHALKDTAVCVPRVFHYCTREDVVGKEFYVMEYVSGRVEEKNEGLDGWRAEDRAAVYNDMNRILAELHNLDYVAKGLERHGSTKGGNYAQRQLRIWGGQFRAATPVIEAHRSTHHKAGLVLEYTGKMEALIGDLSARAASIRDVTTLVHGDYRLGNVILDPDAPKAVAVLDWEISTLGNPLCDLAYFMTTWNKPGSKFLDMQGNDTRPPGIPSAREFLETYCRNRGIDDVPDEEWNFWVAINHFRTAAICHGVYARALQGKAASTEGLDMWAAFVQGTDLGLEMLQGKVHAKL